jgi:hypothetical protein
MTFSALQTEVQRIERGLQAAQAVNAAHADRLAGQGERLVRLELTQAELVRDQTQTASAVTDLQEAQVDLRLSQAKFQGAGLFVATLVTLLAGASSVANLLRYFEAAVP